MYGAGGRASASLEPIVNDSWHQIYTSSVSVTGTMAKKTTATTPPRAVHTLLYLTFLPGWLTRMC